MYIKPSTSSLFLAFICVTSLLEINTKKLLTLSQTSPGFYVSAEQVF